MARGRSVIIGGGLGTVGALVLGAFVSVAQTDPAAVEVSDYLGDTATGVVIASGRTDPQAAATEVLRIDGGMIVENAGYPESVSIGRAHTMTGSFSNGSVMIGTLNTLTSAGGLNPSVSIIIGYDAEAIGTASNVNGAIVIGYLASISAGSITGAICIGTSTTMTVGTGVCIGNTASVAGASSVAIGAGASITSGGGSSVVIGNNAQSSQGNCVAVGLSATCATGANAVAVGSASSTGATGTIAIGANATVGAHAGSICIGNNITSYQANTCMIAGQNTAHINTLHIGGPNTSTTAGSVTIRITNMSGTNAAAGNLSLVAGLSTGNAIAGDIQLRVGVPAGSGTALQLERTGLAVRDTALAGDTYLMVFDVDNLTLERVTVGAANSGGAGFKLLRIPN